VKDNDHYVRELLDAIREIYASSEKISRFVDVHLVIDAFDRQFNTWRNIARLFARTDYVMMLDIDFYLCTDFRSAIRNNPEIMSKLQEGQSAFVIPAFEYANYADGTDYAKFPRDKQVRTLMFVLLAPFERRRRWFHSLGQTALGCSMMCGPQDTIVLTIRNTIPLLRGQFIRLLDTSQLTNLILFSRRKALLGGFYFPFAILSQLDGPGAMSAS